MIIKEVPVYNYLESLTKAYSSLETANMPFIAIRQSSLECDTIGFLFCMPF